MRAIVERGGVARRRDQGFGILGAQPAGGGEVPAAAVIGRDCVDQAQVRFVGDADADRLDTDRDQ
ncbi:MAG: hypothetical protein WDN24_13645 [Sphingomonas sp.]